MADPNALPEWIVSAQEQISDLARRVLELEQWRDAFCARYDQTTRDLWNGIGGR
jgi:hypothetical protein